MRKTVIALIVMVVALPAGAGIHSLEPSEIVVNAGDTFMIVRGIYLGDRASFSGPAGDFLVDVSFGGGNSVHVWVPTEILNTIGWHSVQILGGPKGDSNIVGFRVVPLPPPPPLPLRVHTTPSPLTIPATNRDGEIVTYEVWTSGGKDDPNPHVSCSPVSGSLFRYGTTTVRCEATNAFGERATTALQIIIYDASSPELTLPDDIVVPAEGPDGATVMYQASASDVIDGDLPVKCSPPSGSRFPIGVTTVQCSATDRSYNPANGTFTVEVVNEDPDPEPEEFVIDVPDPITAEAEGPDGAVVTFTVTASGTSDPDPDISCTPASGSTFPLGTTNVQCTATDSFGSTASGDFDVTVVDSVPPMISSITATPNVLSPPNNKFVSVTISVSVSDMVDPMPRCSIFDVTSADPIDGDAYITGDLTVDLRAEREGTERLYEVHVRCTDASGNVDEGSATVRVPKGSEQHADPVTAPRRKSFKRWW